MAFTTSLVLEAYEEDIRFRYGLIKLILILIKRCIINKNTFLITAVTTVTITRTLTIVANSLRKLIDCTAILIANILAAKNLLLCQNVALSAKPSPSFLFFFFLSIKGGNQKFQFLEAPSILSAGMHIV